MGELREKITTETLVEKIPAEKCWAITAKALLRILIMRDRKYILPLLGEGEGIISPVLAWEKWREMTADKGFGEHYVFTKSSNTVLKLPIEFGETLLNEIKEKKIVRLDQFASELDITISEGKLLLNKFIREGVLDGMYIQETDGEWFVAHSFIEELVIILHENKKTNLTSLSEEFNMSKTLLVQILNKLIETGKIEGTISETNEFILPTPEVKPDEKEDAVFIPVSEDLEHTAPKELQNMYCRRCGQPIPAEGNFCPHCGEPIKIL